MKHEQVVDLLVKLREELASHPSEESIRGLLTRDAVLAQVFGAYGWSYVVLPNVLDHFDIKEWPDEIADIPTRPPLTVGGLLDFLNTQNRGTS